MYRATTPFQNLRFPEDVSQMGDIQITYSQGGCIVMEKHKEDLSFSEDGKTASFILTQAETKRFKEGQCSIQARLITPEGICMASKIKKLSVNEVLHDNILLAGGE